MALDDIKPTDDKMKEIVRAGDYGIAVDEFGTTTNPFQHQTEALKARIFHGASKIEFSFFGRGKGNKEAATPESFGARDRMDMRELARVNEVETSTHASVGIGGLSGLQMQSFRFDEHTRKESIDEVKRAIHFAAEATTGGAIVFHTGEAPRSMVSRTWRDDGTHFMLHPEEEKEELHYLVDPIEKRIVAQIKENERIAIPVQARDPTSDDGLAWLRDEYGKYVVDDITNKRIPVYKHDKKGNIETEITTFKDFREEREKKIRSEGKNLNEQTREQIIKDFYEFQTMRDINYFLGQSKQFETEYYKGLQDRQKIIDTLNYYKEVRSKVSPQEWENFKQLGYESARMSGYFIPRDVLDPVKYLEEKLNENTRSIGYGREVALSGRRQAQETLDRVRRSELVERYAAGKAGESIGELGVYAYDMYQKNKKDLKNPLYVAPENLFPETYGSHPDELRDLVLKGRADMVARLTKYRNIDKKEAEELAKKHIKATFDIGHVNVWRKYYKSDPKDSPEDRDKKFEQWVLKKTDQLFKEGIIGHIHVSDNYGFHDEHLTAGDGNSPIKEFIKQAKKSGFSEFIIESGSFNANLSLPDTWSHFGTGVFGAYGVHVPGFTPNNFAEIRHGYFGRAGPPRYIFGEYGPSKEFLGEPFYTGLGLE